MRTLFFASLAAAAVFALPACASTLTEVTSHGMVVTIADVDIDVAFTPDGKFTALNGAVTGTWRIDGDKLCTSSNVDPNETCFAYPKDKKSGDKFVLETPNGAVQVRIK